MHWPFEQKFVNLPTYRSTHSYWQYLRKEQNSGYPPQNGQHFNNFYMHYPSNTTLSIYRYIAAQTVTDSMYSQNKIIVVHVRPGDNWTTAKCTAHSNRILSIYRYNASHTVTDSKYIQIKLLVFYIRPGDNWTTATCTAHPITTLSIYLYIVAHSVTDSRHKRNKLLFFHSRASDNWTTATCTAHPYTTLSIYQKSQHTYLSTVGTYRRKSWFSTSYRATPEHLHHALLIPTYQ